VLFCDYTCLVFFQQSYPIPTWKQDWSDVLLFVITCVGNYFSTVLPNSTYEAGIEWCAALLWLHVLEYFSTVLPNSTYKAGLSDVLLFVIPCVRSIFNSPTIPPIKQGLKWCAAFVITRVRVFFNSPTQFPPIKQGLSDVLLFCDYMCLESIFQQSYPIPQSRDWVMCCSLWFTC
jgi:hypothetical protein